MLLNHRGDVLIQTNPLQYTKPNDIMHCYYTLYKLYFSITELVQVVGN